jgi:hypothetical protein
MSEPTYLKGPLASVDGNLVLLIPLLAGGNQFIDCTRGIGSVEGEYLKVTIPDWMSSKMGFKNGTLLRINNEGGKLNIEAADISN